MIKVRVLFLSIFLLVRTNKILKVKEMVVYLDMPFGDRLDIKIRCKKTYKHQELLAEEGKIYKLIRKVLFSTGLNDLEEVVYFLGENGKEVFISFESELTGFHAHFEFVKEEEKEEDIVLEETVLFLSDMEGNI